MLSVRTAISSRNHGDEKTREEADRSKTSTSVGPTGRPNGVSVDQARSIVRQLDRVARGVVCRGDPELADEEPDEPGERKQGDEHDREADVGHEVPGRRACPR